MPIRSPRALYEIAAIGQNLDDNPDAIDEAPIETEGGTVIEIYALIKKAIGDYFGLVPLPWNDPRLTGIFNEGGTNAGARYRRRIGGYRVASYTFVAKSQFLISEEYYSKDTGEYILETNPFKSMSIGLPKGHSVNEVLTWVLQWENIDNIAGMITPAGRRIDMTVTATGPQ